MSTQVHYEDKVHKVTKVNTLVIRFFILMHHYVKYKWHCNNNFVFAKDHLILRES